MKNLAGARAKLTAALPIAGWASSAGLWSALTLLASITVAPHLATALYAHRYYLSLLAIFAAGFALLAAERACVSLQQLLPMLWRRRPQRRWLRSVREWTPIVLPDIWAAGLLAVPIAHALVR